MHLRYIASSFTLRSCMVSMSFFFFYLLFTPHKALMEMPLHGVGYGRYEWRHEYPQPALTSPDRQRTALQGSKLAAVQYHGTSRGVEQEILEVDRICLQPRLELGTTRSKEGCSNSWPLLPEFHT